MKDVNAPERTRTAYMFFCDKNRKNITKDNPEATMIEISTMLGKMWTETSEKARSPFVSSMEKSRAKYEKAMEKYRQTEEYTEFQKKRRTHDLISKYVKQMPNAKKKSVYTQFPNDPNKPKAPGSAYFIFANEKRAGVMKRILMQV
eukprot:UN22438